MWQGPHRQRADRLCCVNKDSIEGPKIDFETALVRVESEAFDADAEVAVEKIFDIATAAPGVIVADVTVEGAGDGLAFGCALDEIGDVGGWGCTRCL